MIKNVIFDWSGVINDNLSTVYKTAMLVFKQFGIKEITLEEFRREWKQPYMLFYNKYIPDIDIETEQKAYTKAYREVTKTNPPLMYPGIKKVLKRIKGAGINMIIISSDTTETLLEEVEIFGLKEMFDEINSNVHDKCGIIKDTLERNNFKPEETAFVGDTSHEIEAGNEAGTITIAVTWGLQNKERLEKDNPDFLVSNLDELEKAIIFKGRF